MPSSSAADVRAVIDAATPAVIASDPASTGAERLLTPDDLKAAFGNEDVTVSVSERNDFRYDTGAMSPQRMAFADYVHYVQTASGPGGERRYLPQYPLAAIPHGFGFDLVEPVHIPADTVRVAENLWFGPAGTISPLHVDRSHNLLVQHWGRKHVVLVSPHHSAVMKPGPKNSKSPHVSSLDLAPGNTGIDLSRLDAPCFETVVQPGDTLFIPAFWWHNVTAIDAAISTNYWWRPPIESCLYPNFLRMLSSRDVYTDLSIVHRWVDVAPHQLDTALCVHLAEMGHTFGGAALASALVTAFCERTLRALGITDSGPARGAGELLDVGPARSVVSALTAQGVIDVGQSTLLLDWLALAEEIAAEPEAREYTTERTAFINSQISRLHDDCGSWLSA